MKTVFAFALLATAVMTSGVVTSGARAEQSASLHARTAGELAELCGANPREAEAIAKINFCHGFAQGAVDVERKRAEESKLFCFPPSPPNREVVLSEFVAWVRAMPDHRNQPALDGLFHFLGERFPCK
jgi:Rap1a immunity proteins